MRFDLVQALEIFNGWEKVQLKFRVAFFPLYRADDGKLDCSNEEKVLLFHSALSLEVGSILPLFLRWNFLLQLWLPAWVQPGKIRHSSPNRVIIDLYEVRIPYSEHCMQFQWKCWIQFPSQRQLIDRTVYFMWVDLLTHTPETHKSCQNPRELCSMKRRIKNMKNILTSSESHFAELNCHIASIDDSDPFISTLTECNSTNDFPRTYVKNQTLILVDRQSSRGKPEKKGLEPVFFPIFN